MNFISASVVQWREGNFVGNCPGLPQNFGKEHWLQTLIVAAGPVGGHARVSLGLPEPISLVTQIPIGYVGPNGPANLKVDIGAVLPNEFRVLEIKKDNAWTAAKKELRIYTDWLQRRPSSFHPTTGLLINFLPGRYLEDLDTPYLPPVEFALNEDTIFPIAVLQHGANLTDLDGAHLPQIAGCPVLPIRGVMRLPQDWRERACLGQNLFVDGLYQ